MNRLDSVSRQLGSLGVDGIVITNLKNVRYLTGFSGSYGYLIIGGKKRVFGTDFRYAEQSRFEVSGASVFIERGESNREIIERAGSLGIRTLGFEASASYSFYRGLLRRGLRIKAVNSLVEDVRKRKDSGELASIRKAVARAQRAFSEVKPYIRSGVTETKIALMLEERLKQQGCSSLPFDIIVASGRNSALPHARPTQKKILAGDFVIVDWGGEAGGYYSDMTRTFLVKGKSMAPKIELYETVLAANGNAISAVEEGKHARFVDRAARDVIRLAGYEDYFGHGTGHGVGLDVHELPRISWRGGEKVRAGMVFTIEPGIYIPGLGGVRIEDMVLAEKAGCTVLTSLPKHLEVIR